jgi:hypothetical protein
MQNNYRETQSSPEKQYRRKKSSGKLSSFVLGAVLATGIITGANKLIANSHIDYDSDGNSFMPNGGIPEVYFNIDDYKSFKDRDGNITYESFGPTKTSRIHFSEIADGKSLQIEAGGSFRTSPVAANIEKPSAILISNQDMVLDKVDAVGYWEVDNFGDEFYMIEAKDAPADVQKYIAEKKVELPEIDGKEYIFISQGDADFVDSSSVVLDDKSK